MHGVRDGKDVALLEKRTQGKGEKHIEVFVFHHADKLVEVLRIERLQYLVAGHIDILDIDIAVFSCLVIIVLV